MTIHILGPHATATFPLHLPSVYDHKAESQTVWGTNFGIAVCKKAPSSDSNILINHKKLYLLVFVLSSIFRTRNWDKMIAEYFQSLILFIVWIYMWVLCVAISWLCPSSTTQYLSWKYRWMYRKQYFLYLFTGKNITLCETINKTVTSFKVPDGYSFCSF
jgi:hypothetical protein